jgi:hypothetical protein
MEQKETKMKQKDDKRLAREAKIIGALKQVQMWIGENFSMSTVKKLNAISDRDRERELLRPIFTQESDLMDKNPLERACLQLQDHCLIAKRTLITKANKLMAKQRNLSHELKDGQKLKTEIAHDFAKLQKQVESAVNERQCLQDDLSALERTLKERQ